MRGNHFLSFALSLLFLLHRLDFDERLLQLLGLALDVGRQDRQQVPVVVIYLFQSLFDGLTNPSHLTVREI